MLIVDLKRSVDYLLTIAPTDRRVNKDQFNSIINAASTKYYQDAVMMAEIEAKKAGIQLHEYWFAVSSLVRYRSFANLAVTDVQGFTDLPVDYAHYSSFTAYFSGGIHSLRVVTDAELQSMRSSVTKNDLSMNPAGVIYDRKLRVFPHNYGATPIECVYLRFVEMPYYDVCYSVDEGIDVFMPVGSYIKQTFVPGGTIPSLFSGNHMLLKSNVLHSSFFGPNYVSKTAELDIDERFHYDFMITLFSLLGVPYNQSANEEKRTN